MKDMTRTAQLETQALSVTLDRHRVLDGLSVSLPQGKVTMILGPNGCGKSTLLRALARIVTPTAGRVLLEGTDIATLAPKARAKRIGLLPQHPIAPEGLTVQDLVAQGRTPHQGLFRQWEPRDEAATLAALEETGLSDLAHRPVTALSGGQRQRAWIAMLLAQDSETLLLDEPTSALDPRHQIDIFRLLRHQSEVRGKTVIVVVHDLNMAARFADHILALRAGEIVAQGAPQDVITNRTVEAVFDLPCRILTDPESGSPVVVPL